MQVQENQPKPKVSNVNSPLPQKENPMLGVTDYGTFVITIIVFLAIPGPGNLALGHFHQQGRHHGWTGCHRWRHSWGPGAHVVGSGGCGCACWRHTPKPFMLVQWAGAAYLALAGLQDADRQTRRSPCAQHQGRPLPAQAFFITLLNPKAISVLHGLLPLVCGPCQPAGFGDLCIHGQRPSPSSHSCTAWAPRC